MTIRTQTRVDRARRAALITCTGVAPWRRTVTSAAQVRHGLCSRRSQADPGR